MTHKVAETQTVDIDGEQFRTVKEGRATILVPHGAKVGESPSEVQQVFYNPIQQYNRDLSVLAIKAYGEEVLAKRKDHKQFKDFKKGKKRKHGDENGTGAKEPEAAQPAEIEPVVDGDNAPETPKPAYRILDALSASGLRALRYARELPFVTSITANDLSASAANAIKQNVKHNGVEDIVSVTNDDALAVMYRLVADTLSIGQGSKSSRKASKFDVIDLDPYGTAAPFFDAAVQAVRDDGGLLCITCTDSAVWAGHGYSEKTYALYGGTSVHGQHSHEVGLRLIINAVATSAARYGLAIEPQLSLSIDFYTKIFIRVKKSPQAVKFLGSKTMLVYSCDSGCGAWKTQYLMRTKTAPNKNGHGSFYKYVVSQGPSTDRLCQHCGTKMHLNGPMYGGRIHSRSFIERLLKQISTADEGVYGTLPRLEGMLQNALEELIAGPEETAPVDAKDKENAEIDHCPFYIVPSKLAGVLSCGTPGDDMMKGALKHLGYVAGRSHCKAGSIKTDAPWSTIWWIMTEWIRQKSPINKSKYKPHTAPWRLLTRAGLLEKEAGGQSDEAADLKPMDFESGAVAGDTLAAAECDADGKKPMTEADLRKTLVFNYQLGCLGRQDKVENRVRYQVNPRENWGPMSKAKKN